MAEYRVNYEKSRMTNELNKLNKELAVMKSKVVQPTYQMPFRAPNNNFFEMDRWFTEKLLLIGGCIAIGAIVTYLFLNKKK